MGRNNAKLNVSGFAFYGRTHNEMADIITDKASVISAEVSKDSPVFSRGFYWVKLKSAKSNTEWQPAKFKRYMEDGEEMFVLRGDEPFYEHEDFSAIIPLLPPQ